MILRTTNSIMTEIFNRISENKPFDKKLKPYSKEKINMALDYFLEKEEYEKCKLLKEFIEKKFTHGNDYLK